MSARNGTPARLAGLVVALGALGVFGALDANRTPAFGLTPATAVTREAPGQERGDLAVDAPAITFSSSALAIDVAVGGSLAGRRLSVLVFVDGNLIETYPTTGAKTRLTVAGLDLSPGMHELLIKSGTFEARDRFRFVNPVVPAWVAGLALGVVALIFVRSRRRGRVA